MLGSEVGLGDLGDGAIGGGEGSVCTPRFAAGVANSALPAADGPCSQVVPGCGLGASASACGERLGIGGNGEASVSSYEVRLTEAGSNRAGAVPGRISLLYESRDGGICVFEDAEGHLTSVRASRLA